MVVEKYYYLLKSFYSYLFGFLRPLLSLSHTRVEINDHCLSGKNNLIFKVFVWRFRGSGNAFFERRITAPGNTKINCHPKLAEKFQLLFKLVTSSRYVQFTSFSSFVHATHISWDTKFSGWYKLMARWVTGKTLRLHASLPRPWRIFFRHLEAL